ncbi:MAG: cysteine--tRNA ligase [Lactobacillus iners]|nr:cysteine--tRNA ligase [Lactobacillus iners]MCT7865677.1 cysteine--tRNA ligase [Lactobacillus iners]
MKIFNTLSNKKEEFKPQIAGKVNMYVCGPTVYNYIHIGNARSVIAFDTIRRYLEYRGYEVKYISNFTDVDDKMINQARKENVSVAGLADRYIKAFVSDTTALNIKPATFNPRATEEITDIISFIKVLIAKGYAYVVDNDVYFRAKKFTKYGCLSGQNIDELEEGASQHISVEEQKKKEDAIDFALWKGQKTLDEIAWNSPWGKGRPGWHIECSVMSTKYLGNTIDIHGGGQDLQFPHHENELAQSEAKTGQKFVNYWLHNGFVTVGEKQEKMSKSLNNFITVHDLLKKVDPQVLRFYMSSVQYRKPINYTEDGLRQAETVLKRYKNILRNIEERLSEKNDATDSDLAERLIDAKKKFIAAMDDDFNVQNALSVMHELTLHVNVHLNNDFIDHKNLQDFVQLMDEWLLIFGVKITTEMENDDTIQKLVDQRNLARQNKDWATSDQIRDELLAKGIILEDTPQGTRWHHVKA